MKYLLGLLGIYFVKRMTLAEKMKRVKRQSNFQVFLLKSGIPQSDDVEIYMCEKPKGIREVISEFFYFLS